MQYGPAGGQKGSVVFRPSLFVIADMKMGEIFTEKNVKITRPGYGLLPKHLPEVLGKHAAKDIARGTPVSVDLVT